MKLRVVQPQIDLKGDMAADALSAYCQHSNGDRAFVFNADVDMAECFAKLFRRAGIRAGCIEGNTPHAYRRDAIGSFSTLDESMIGTRVLTSVYTLQEGIDVPIASVAILARRFQFSGALLQSVGRIGRPAEGKVHATVIDLTGATIRHGSPNADRDYSLEGRAIVPRTKGVEREPAERGFHVIRPTDLVVAERGSEPAGWEPKPVVTKYIPTAEEVETIIGRVLGRSGSTVARTIRKVVQGMAS
jgi:superfamily II DNA or RNA helicase